MAKVESVINTVKMDDGRIVEFAGKRKMLKETLFNPDGTITIRLDFSNGEVRTYTIVEKLMAKFAAHGAEQKLGDEIAGVVDVEDCIMAIDDLLARLETGSWTIKRESNGMAGVSLLARALVEHSGKDAATIKQFLLAKSHAEKIALRNNPSIKPIIDRLEAEKSGKKESNIDTDSMLGELAA